MVKNILNISIYSNDYYANIKILLLFNLITFVFFSICTAVLNGFKFDSFIYLFWVVISFLAIVSHLRTKFSLKTFKIIAFYFVLGLVITTCFFSLRYDNKIDNGYYFLGLITILPIIFDIRTDKKKFILLVLASVISVIVLNTFSLGDKYLILSSSTSIELLRYYNISFAMLTVIYTTVFFVQKDVHFQETKSKVNKIEKSLRGLNKQFTKQEISDLLSIAKMNSVLFLEKFEIYFPEFLKNIQKGSGSFNTMDLYVLALIKIGLDTKEIAVVSNTTIKSVESRKYRLKKRLEIESNVKIDDYIKTL
ncbi:hypothetical protein FPF71_04550 [Algibacter amylolyticus]|uniref:Uncharacterized protein n=1 Tax=Algibacter amylolyticus TaxID=1608400 RepID=A0A5M7BFL0_9FLAO|nr:LuxR C-terminal-related transcriptional regulator [Algibacter amylolyticus]KAA5828109.1 hypothetical protein F2B50_04550 [Algibacter amylolyticus]MBB5267357.1 DNA-binding CsgD family transcriptional regulator [Algibacter amylolyticus]TSJ82354.1 hypothetical protein FPF71_04550 [Algibacter amylolyticus]